MSTWSKRSPHLKQQRKFKFLLISGCSLALLYCAVHRLPETSKQGGAPKSPFDFDLNSVITWIFRLPVSNYLSRAWPIEKRSIANDDHNRSMDSPYQLVGADREGGGEDAVHQARRGNDGNITRNDLKETKDPMRELDNVNLQPRRGRWVRHFSELQTWLRHVIPNSKRPRQLRHNGEHNRRLGYVSTSDRVNSGNQSFGDSTGEYHSFGANETYSPNGGYDRTNYSNLGGGGGIFMRQPPVNSGNQSYGDSMGGYYSFGTNQTYGHYGGSNYSDLGGGGGNFTRQPPLKQSPPKYGNCDDDVDNITSPCYGYSSSYRGGDVETSAAASPPGSATINPNASPEPPVGSSPGKNPIAYPAPPFTSAPSTFPPLAHTGASIGAKSQAPSVSPTTLPPVGKHNLLLFDVSVLQSSVVPHNITEHVTGVMSDILNGTTPFPVFFSDFTLQGQHANSSVILVQDPNASVVTLLSSLSPTTSWRQYEVGYRCYYHPSNVPIRNETLWEQIFSICLNAVDASIMSGSFLHQLVPAAKESNVDVLDVAISGYESNNVTPSSGVAPPGSRTYPQALSTTGLDLRRLIGLAIAVATVCSSTILMLLGAQRERKGKHDELWSFGLATEQDVGNLLNLGFMWQQGEGHGGPPKGVIIFNKQRIGYRDDDSVLMGGFHDPNLVMQTAEVTLPSSGTSQGSERLPNPVLTSLLVTR